MSGSPFAHRTWISADGLTLHARDYAPGPGEARTPVVCIHGLTRNARDFEALAPFLAARGRRVLAVDVRGRGDSARDSDPSNYQPPIYAQDVLSLLDALGIGRAVFIGTSMGGLITLAVAVFRPSIIAAAVLNDVGPELGAAGLARITGYAGRTAKVADWAEAADFARAVNGSAFPDYRPADWAAFARRIFTDGETGPVLDYDPAIAAGLKPPDGEPPRAPPDLWPFFAALATPPRPLLLIHGALSDLLTPEIVAKMRQAAPNMAYVEVPRVGHAPMLDEPAALAAIQTFIAHAP